MKRSSGIIMHISSLPNKYGIGTLGKEAYEFADFLDRAGQMYWQMLPLGPTSYGDSPYQSFSAFAGNPYFIDFDILNKDGILDKNDYENIDFGDNPEDIDYGLIFDKKIPVLRQAYENFKGRQELQNQFEEFKNNEFWLQDYAMYMAVKNKFELKSWQEWDDDIKLRNNSALERYKDELKDDINFWCFVQFEFYKQWTALKKYVNDLGIEIIGDMPIYVAEDSADIWSNPDAFLLDKETLKPIKVAGCPPDIFSETGQLWGNPIYDWKWMDENGYEWWIKRIKHSLKLYDWIRIDHFKGFESYYSIPYGEDTAINGEWVKGPGMRIFDAIRKKLGNVNIIAEDLGALTDETIKLRDDNKFPGMKVLTFAFDSDSSNMFLPHNYDRNFIAYTGTHDNDTVRGWVETTATKEQVEKAVDYLKLTEEEGYNWGLIRGIWSSIANVSIAQMQDFLDLGNKARTNMPSTLGHNWRWRAKKESFTKELAEKIYTMTKRYGRCKKSNKSCDKEGQIA